jgi:hypothetical protein
MEGVLNTPMSTNARARRRRVSRQADDILPLFGTDLFPEGTNGFNQADGFDSIPGRMSGNQPGNIIGYRVVPPLLPALINFICTGIPSRLSPLCTP